MMLALARNRLGLHQAGSALHANVLRHRVGGPPALDRRDDDERKQNFAWYRLDARYSAGPIFHAYGSAPMSSRVSLCIQCNKAYRPQRSDSKFCSDTCRQRAHRGRLAVTQAWRTRSRSRCCVGLLAASMRCSPLHQFVAMLLR